MRVRWTPAAAADLQQISDYLRERHPRYRQATLRKLYETIRRLGDVPHLGKPGRVEGTREILFPPMPYVAVYRVREQSIEVLRIWHTAQNRG
jgi:addiction module RelE/StbE family toxin